VWRHSTLIIPSLIAGRQSIVLSNPKYSRFCEGNQHSSPLRQAKRSRCRSSLTIAVKFLRVMYIKDKQILVFNFIFDLLWTGSGSSVCSVALLGFRKLKEIEKHWFKGIL
jgi:hypothetical protein